MNKLIYLYLFILNILYIHNSYAKDISSQLNVNGNLLLATDYRFWGISQTNNNPSIQATLSFEHETGFYVTLWGSNVDLLPGNSLEADYFLGYKLKINNQTTIDFQYLDMNYPGASKDFQPNFSEYAVIYSHIDNIKKGDSLIISGYFTPEYAMESGKQYYLNISANYPLFSSWILLGSLGYNKLENKENFIKAYGFGEKDNYLDYKIGLKTQIIGLEAELSWLDTNIKRGPDSTKQTFYFSLSKSF
ncbi:TorF family putative porin [Acinetobacter pittii]|uniref:TorF family putative porin n=1 Tax=Acinetobacter pittii TaxID=48296 RepID=UPI0030086E08